MVVNGGGGADSDLQLLVPIATSLSLALAAATLVLAYVCCRRRAEPTFDKDHEGHPVGGGGRSASNDTLAESGADEAIQHRQRPLYAHFGVRPPGVVPAWPHRDATP
ncbi:hypothetical protein MTO96_020532 [Rhipicephalus appendiculatus]